LLQDVWLLEKLAHFAREVTAERGMHAEGAGAHGTFTVTHDITRYARAKIFSEISRLRPAPTSRGMNLHFARRRHGSVRKLLVCAIRCSVAGLGPPNAAIEER
jgi:hypothetical protein